MFGVSVPYHRPVADQEDRQPPVGQKGSFASDGYRSQAEISAKSGEGADESSV
ncbi:hypothetical protein N9X16_02610 [Planktomarina temperata]|jgi:hypothetical protein|uniref:hypothetical protein n=1 Tax=Planktomarina temperata TaxID=1284658 RepID=UPI002303F54C|nr:hypothetical protein [Planktomarina temperata]MDB2521903.1 hypothetical protein [Planktomarina temperata]MDB4020648.1 hypothetical protein [Planktomarina temperata]MDO7734004.1 hypothetical protein [Planktomarina temperata]